MDEKIYLLKNHFLVNLSINLPILYPDISSNFLPFQTDITDKTIINAINQVAHQIELYLCDPIILKIVLIILTFSTGEARHWNILDSNEVHQNSIAIFHMQNMYLTLLWRYIDSRSNSEKQTQKFFSQLFFILLCIQRLTLFFDKYVANADDDLKQMDPLMRTMWPRFDFNATE